MTNSRRARAGIILAVAGVIAVGGAGVALLGAMVDETHFARPTADFDALREETDAVDGVTVLQSERWVEAPTFSHPSSWMSVETTPAALPALLETVCDNTYDEPVSWAVEVVSSSGTRVSLFSDAALGCARFGLNAVGAVAKIDAVAPGVQVQAAVADSRTLTLFSFAYDGLDAVAPLVAGAEAIRAAALLPADMPVEVAGSQLGVTVRPGEGAAYNALLTRLIDDFDVTYFSFGGGGTPVDGVEKLQVIAPQENHAAIASLIEESALPVAALPVMFLES